MFCTLRGSKPRTNAYTWGTIKLCAVRPMAGIQKPRPWMKLDKISENLCIVPQSTEIQELIETGLWHRSNRKVLHSRLWYSRKSQWQPSFTNGKNTEQWWMHLCDLVFYRRKHNSNKKKKKSLNGRTKEIWAIDWDLCLF